MTQEEIHAAIIHHANSIMQIIDEAAKQDVFVNVELRTYSGITVDLFRKERVAQITTLNKQNLTFEKIKSLPILPDQSNFTTDNAQNQ